MIARADVAAEARRWLKTPYHHQARARGIGVDCGGLIGGVALALGIVADDWWSTTFAPHAGYARQPSQGMLERICDSFMPRIDVASADVGDVLGFRFARETQHLGFLVPYEAAAGLAVVHALSSVGCVTEHRLSTTWRARVTCAWRLPGVA